MDVFDPVDNKEDASTSINDNRNPMPEVPCITSPNLSSYDLKDDEENGEFCDGPVTRTRSKVGGQNSIDDIPPSFLVQIPHYAYKQEKNKKCQVCGKHARTPSDLLRHMRVHTGERPFPCVACEKTFKCKRSQLTHQYLSHAIKDGLSEHRLDVLDNRKVKRSSASKLKECFTNLQMPTLIDQIRNNSFMKQDLYQPTPFEQDEDTEIVAGDEISLAADSQISFGGLFSAQKENTDMCIKREKSRSPNIDERDTCRNVNENMLSILNSCHGGYLDMKHTNDDSPEDCMLENKSLEETSKNRKESSKRVPILRIKTHKCTHCKRQFRSIYTLRYHLRSMHDEKVYLSPALESRLKKRRWIPPHVRLQKSKISMTNSQAKREHSVIKHSNEAINYSTIPSYSTDQIEQKFLSSPMLNDHTNEHSKSEDAIDLHINKDLTLEIKKEKIDSYEDEINNNTIPNSVNECSNRTLREILTSKANDIKQMSNFASSLTNPTLNLNGNSFNMNNSSTTNPSNPFVIPPHIFFPSNPASEEGLMNEKPISWESLQVTSESVLISKLEAIHPGTQQKYVLYKCGLCGKAFASLRVICAHLAVHNDANKEKDCEKCGASFKWRNELDSHLECHQVSDRKYLPTSPYLPSYYVNPFPIPVVTPTEQSVMSATGLPTGLLPYPFFPMPQQMPPMMQPGFFPFFAAALQPSGDELRNDSMRNGNCSPSEDNRRENFDDKSLVQGCTFQCKLCPKTFDRIFSLQRHERIHSGVKACFCKVCGRGFSELRNLRHHIIRFHADSAQREPLPYRRRPNRIRNVSSSQKLVSFLKKTAVRILNSMGQSKLDPPSQSEISSSSVKIQTEEMQESEENKKQENLPTTISTSIEQSSPLSETVTSMPQLYDATSHTTQSHSTPELNEIPPPRLSPGAIEEKDLKSSASEKGKNGTVELLQDPKRSLLGNRRKGRPFKLSTSSYQTLSLSADDLLFPVTDNSFLEKQNDAITTSNLLQAAEALSGCMKTELGLPPLSFFNPEPPSNEPIDMRNPNVKDKPQPSPLSTFEINDAQERNSTISTDNTMGIGMFNDPLQSSPALTLPDIKETFESRCMFPCSYCHKSFNSLTDLNRHMSFHADIRPFKCPYCSYCSRTNSQLKVHMMRHEGIKHYMCQICNYNGVTQSDLNRHLKTRTHLLRSRNVCACCGTGFHTRSLSDEHFKSCHLSMNSGNQDQNKVVPEPSSTKSSSSNRNRVTRLKQFRTPEEKIKNDFYQKLCDLNNMGLTLGDFLQQNATSVNIEK